MGYDEKRGDQVEIINMPFSWAIPEEELKPDKGVIWKEYAGDFYKPAVSLLLALLFIFFVVKPLLKRRPPLAQEKGMPMLAEGDQPAGPGAPQVTGAQKPLEIRDQTLQLIQKDPSKTAGIVKTWLHERE
jgi:flagellar biosynthesis/type III secretory pathway M-ring protein FliF/YscJ